LLQQAQVVLTLAALATSSSLSVAVVTRDPHIIQFFSLYYSNLKFLFDFPLLLEYLPIILIILHDLGTYAGLSAWLVSCFLPEGETQLTLTLRILQNLHGSERAGE